jgi:hypothetical protein
MYGRSNKKSMVYTVDKRCSAHSKQIVASFDYYQKNYVHSINRLEASIKICSADAASIDVVFRS